ncbi:MAG: YraN family protein [Dysgonamonadaceae bacterium]
MAQHNELGKMGEEAARLFLVRKNYKILYRNWRFEKYEVDIVAEDVDELVFIEVKTRTSAEWGNPQDAIGKQRVKRLVEAAHYFLQMQDCDKSVRFDIIGAIWNGQDFEIEHIEDAFLPPVNI